MKTGDYSNGDVRKMALELQGQAARIGDDAPSAMARRALLFRAAGYLLLAYGELSGLDALGHLAPLAFDE